MKMLKKHIVILASMVTALVVISSSTQASGKAHISFVPAVIVPSVIVPIDDYHQDRRQNNYENKLNSHYSKNVYKTNYRANSNYKVKRGFTSKVVNSGRSFNLNSKTVIRKLR